MRDGGVVEVGAVVAQIEPSVGSLMLEDEVAVPPRRAGVLALFCDLAELRECGRHVAVIDPLEAQVVCPGPGAVLVLVADNPVTGPDCRVKIALLARLSVSPEQAPHDLSCVEHKRREAVALVATLPAALRMLYAEGPVSHPYGALSDIVTLEDLRAIPHGWNDVPRDLRVSRAPAREVVGANPTRAHNVLRVADPANRRSDQPVESWAGYRLGVRWTSATADVSRIPHQHHHVRRPETASQLRHHLSQIPPSQRELAHPVNIPS